MPIIGVLKEREDENRVALVPDIALSIKKISAVDILVETNAGLKAGFLNQDYAKAGAQVLTREKIIKDAHIFLAINGLSLKDEQGLSNKTIIGLFDPYFNKEAIKALKEQGTTLISLELIPRISRAQSMDVLSSQANIAGYMAMVLAASRLNKVIPLMMTAAGTIKPAKVLVVGAGVAGLQVIATAKRLGALVFAYDVRAAVKEQVESLGAKFIDITLSESGEGTGGYAKALTEDSQKLQRAKLAHAAKDMDIVITTAQIPGRKAPLLLDEEVFLLMKPDTIIIDMASSSGGNVASSISNEWVKRQNVWLYGADNLAASLPKDASFTFSKNLESLLTMMNMGSELNLDDEILKDAVICHQNQWINQAYQASLEAV
jgi:NAD(P) transhydrogenase subunit alpha